ncbi:non-homologous end joining protein Ku [Alloalcanivorax mobilis]
MADAGTARRPAKAKARAGKKHPRRSKKTADTHHQHGQARPFWSGTLSFALVSVPVGLFPANRGKALSLRWVDRDGARLARRYYCSKEDIELGSDDLVRGYPVGDDRYVVITDRELEQLAPDKSQEISLQRFVPLEQVDPMRFERAYFLTPEKGGIKAYRMLARAMQDSARAGIATFVLRGKEHLVAILSHNGILRVETLRFDEELRSPGDVGLAAPSAPASPVVKRFLSAMKPLRKAKLDARQLSDRHARRVLEQARKKRKAGRDLIAVAASEKSRTAAPTQEPVDLMAVLKRGLKEGLPASSASGRGKKRSDSDGDLGALSKNELYQRAKRQHIEGRSRMTKAQLISALEAAAA